jgi:cell division protein FtsQ
MRRSHIIGRAGRNPEDGLKARLIRYGRRLAVLALILWIGAWLSMSGTIDRGQEAARATIVQALAQAGFRVENILVEGRQNLDVATLKALVNMERGAPLFAFDPDTAQSLLQSVPWVRSAHIERRWPDTLYIRITERAPFALWSREGRLALIADDGTVLTERGLEPYRHLIVLTGAHAPQNAAELMSLLKAQPEIAAHVDSAGWVGDRRWDLRLKNGTIVRLPETEAALALTRLSDAHVKDRLLDTALDTIDLREQTRIVVRTRENAQLRALTSAIAPAAGASE